MTHSLEPWEVRGGYHPAADWEMEVVDAENKPIIEAGLGGVVDNNGDLTEQNWKRIVACVNFCRKLTTKYLNTHDLDWLDSDANHQLRYKDKQILQSTPKTSAPEDSR